MCARKARVLICRSRWEFSAPTAISRKQYNLIHVLCVGELSLDGRVRPIKGALPIAMLAREGSIRHLILPEENAKEAAVVAGVNVYPVADLRSAVKLIAELRSETPPAAVARSMSLKYCGERVITASISRKCAGRFRPSERWRSRSPVVITFCSLVRPVRARRCWRNVCRRSCRRSSLKRRWS